LVRFNYCHSRIARPWSEPRDCCFDMSRRARLLCQRSTHLPTKNNFQVNYRFHNSRVCSNAGRAAVCSPDIVHRRPKITDRRRPRFHLALPQSSISFGSKQHQRFDTVRTNKNIRTIRNMRNYSTQAAGESQSLIDCRKLIWLLRWQDFTEEANNL
jgi:hypothetical protein